MSQALPGPGRPDKFLKNSPKNVDKNIFN
jgi:hypothetical protein